MAFLLVTFAWSQYSLSLLPTFGITVLAIGLLLWLLPSRAVSLSATRPPGWDLPARMVIATTFVLVLTGSASALGPQLSGLITPFPLFATVLAAFAHEQQGPAAAVQVLRGMALSLFGVAGFFLIVGGLLPSLGMVWTYLLATIVIVSLNSFSLRSDRRRRIP
jgi:hypothetical protein